MIGSRDCFTFVLLICVSAEYCIESGVPPKALHVVYGGTFGVDAPRMINRKPSSNTLSPAPWMCVQKPRNMVLTSGLGWAPRRHKPIVWPTLPHQLEVDSAGQLHETGAGSARKLSERSVRLRSCCRVELGTRIYARELRVVERVVGFSPDFQGYPLTHVDRIERSEEGSTGQVCLF